MSNSSAPQGSPDGYNSVFYSNTIFGEGFGDNTLAVTVAGSHTVVVSIEAGAGSIGLVELYDLSSDNSGKIANISTPARVRFKV